MIDMKEVIDQLLLLEAYSDQISLSEDEKEFFTFSNDLTSKALSRIKNRELNIYVVGTMKSGKSTFINALLGRDILPNENAACTLVPVNIINGLFDNKIEKTLSNNQSQFILKKPIEKAFLDDIREYRTGLEMGDQVDIQHYSFTHTIICLSDSLEKVKLKIVDTPGPNEMKQFVETIDLENTFSNCLKESSLIFFVIDVQYYIDEENKKLLDLIRYYRPDIKNNVIFILNKMDRLMEQKDVTSDTTIRDVKETLSCWGYNKNLVFPISAKKALLSRLTEKKVNSKGSVLKRIISLFKKEPSILEIYKQDFDDILPLLEKEIDGRVFSCKPEPEEYYQELFIQSNIKELEEYIKKTIDNNLEQTESILTQEIVESIRSWLNTVVINNVNLLDEKVVKLPFNDLNKKRRTIMNAIKKIHSFYNDNKVDYLLKGIVKNDIENEILAENNFSSRFSNSYMPSYSTSWVEYRDDNEYIDPESTEPGYQRRRLEEYFKEVIEEAGDRVNAIARKQIRAKKEILKENLNKFAKDLESELDLFYKDNSIAFKIPISKVSNYVIDENYIPSLSAPPYIPIESKSRSKERLIFKGRGDVYYRSFRLTNVSEFKDSCRERVDNLFYTAASFVFGSLRNIVVKQVLPSYKQQLEQIVNIFEEQLRIVDNEFYTCEKEKKYLLTLKNDLLSILDPQSETFKKNKNSISSGVQSSIQNLQEVS
ncbi:clamp-binding protein CrfC [Desulfosporosinus acididurans]|uniref:Clamp-binding protein CrfC n=1 Tax=Desulfosporosinus acididurans TaxID=476652 RepID=A0A0J1FLH1_9FIRM|nr:dynamin family protein [Desulfosporosinus acididurans]KLU63783.1 clamp-binding protein CrfC [Desulfosporosinus acididurans]